jgi:hypothetical protein
MNSINLTPILQAIIALLAALITYRLIPWIKARTTATQQDNLRALVKVLVFAAEQIFGAGHGPEKLKYVQSKLADKGFLVDTDEIEAAVAENLNLTFSVDEDYYIDDGTEDEEEEGEPTEPAE